MTLLLIEAARILKLDPAQGWPQTIAHDGLAALQTYREGVDGTTWGSKARTWRKALELAMASGAIEHTSTTKRVQIVPAVRRVIHPGLGRSEWDERGFQSRSFLGGTLRTGYTQPAQHRDVTRHHITAPVFAAWLAAQGQEPSPHIAAWFEAVGAQAAPAETTAERNARWLLVWDKESPVHAKGSQARAIEAIAAAEGVAPDTAKAGLQSANKARTASQRAAGVVPMKRGKNTANDPFNRVPPKATARR